MFHRVCKQFSRSVLTLKRVSFECKWNSLAKLFCTYQSKYDYGGLSVDDDKVIKYLTKVRTEYYDLVNRQESLGRDGHEKIKELQQTVSVFECRNSTIEDLAVLNEELSKEKDADLLSLMKDEKEVMVVLH